VPVEVVREPVGKTVLKKFWKTSKRFGFVPKFVKIKCKSSAFVLKNSGTHQNVLVLFQSF